MMQQAGLRFVPSRANSILRPLGMMSVPRMQSPLLMAGMMPRRCLYVDPSISTSFMESNCNQFLVL